MNNRKDFYNTPAWKNTRQSYMKSVGHLCERCLAKGLYTPAEIVHHIIPLTDSNVNDLRISLDWNNLQALCRTCHAEVHEEMYRARRDLRYTIDSNGHVTATEK